MKRLTLSLGLATVAATLSLGPSVHAQAPGYPPLFRTLPPPTAGFAFGGQVGPLGPVGLGPVGVVGAGLVSTPVALPGAGTLYSTYPGVPFDPAGIGYYNLLAGLTDSFGGYLRGSADVINAQANFQKTREQANLIRERTRQQEIDNRLRRAEADGRIRSMETAAAAERLERDRARQIAQSQAAAPAEIWSGRALNDLLDDARRHQTQGVFGPNVPVDANTLKQVNVTGADGGSIALLKDGGKLTWPATLQDPQFEEPRKRVEELAAQAVKEAQAGRVAAGTVQDLKTESERLSTLLAKQISEYTPQQYIAAKRHLKQLSDAVRALSSPDAPRYFTARFTPQGKNVAELVKSMSEKGLRFAPAANGDEAAYTALHRALVQYHQGLQARANGKE